ncbi:uncharacterized protein A1O5_04837 [Cladophialophora psammophila CBS 110553]|uniref:Uncharacterized protein n=1 Tax=Cladophialophora psammophila CBS 110553 TaxID=1182543 RepID=W9WWP1_9EURO|nr:uncharacterized protein A1O5_04837 [Cladophialophora psammophila CBS 110553]EXJ72333.1 hypothetical protein A1O5_04837 [Cladophialophora psammophila CBS 110553]
MTPELSFKSSPQSLSEALSTTPHEDAKTVVAAVPSLTKEAKQQYLINQIKKLVEDCEDFIGLVPGPHGVPEVVVSPNLKKDRWAIIGESHGTFAQYLSMRSPSAPEGENLKARARNRPRNARWRNYLVRATSFEATQIQNQPLLKEFIKIQVSAEWWRNKALGGSRISNPSG